MSTIGRITLFGFVACCLSAIDVASQANFFSTALAQSSPGAYIVTHHETILNPVHNSGFRVASSCRFAAQPCHWDDPDTWQSGNTPDSNTRVILDGHVQIRDQSAVARSIGIYPGGKLTFAANADSRLLTADLLVFDGGTLHIGTGSAPIGSAYRAEVIFRDVPFDAADSDQHLRGLLALNGLVRVFGHALEEAFLRTASEPKQGDSELTLAQSATDAGWRVGDSVVVPTSRQCVVGPGGCPDETEERTITNISGDGLIVTLNQTIQFDHPGARNHAGSLDFMPHVINKSRNVNFRSENPNGVRGHLLFHGRADIDMRFANISDMGRTDIRNFGPTNQKGRYPVHAHHLTGPVTAQTNGYQFTLVGNVIDFGEQNAEQDRKWGISIHGSHYGLIEQNVVDYASGAAIVTESGSEMGNVFRENFAVRVVGGNGASTEDRDPGDGSKSGRAGVGYWFNGGGRNYIENNIAASVAECVYCYGFKFDNVRNGEILFPSVQGSDPHVDGGETIVAEAVGLNNFSGNEAYAIPNGLTIWWECTYGDYPNDSCTSRVDSFNVWHHHRWGYHGYPVNNMTLANFVVRGDPAVLTSRYQLVIGLEFGDYMHRNLLVVDADIQNVQTGINMSSMRHERGATGSNVGFNTVKDSYLVATQGVGVWAPASVNLPTETLSPQSTELRNVRFDYPNADQSGQDRAHITLHDTSVIYNDSKTNYGLRNDVRVYNYNRRPGVDGDDLYIVPTYQGQGRCDDSIGICSSETTAGFEHIDKGHVYQLRDGDTPTTTPPAATLVSPSATASGTPTYVWNAVSNASWYYLWVNDATGTRIKKWYTAVSVNCASGESVCSATPQTNVTGDVTWWVRTWNREGSGPWSSSLQFSVPPAHAVLISPSGTSNGTSPTYVWNAVSGSSWYYLWVNDTSGNVIKTWITKAAAGCPAGTGTCSYNSSTAVNGSSKWWIRTWNKSGSGPWSAQMTFSP